MLMITECPRRKRSPSSTEAVRGPVDSTTGGEGANPANTASAMQNVATSTEYASVRPDTPMSRPPIDGPTIIPNVP